MTNTTHQPEGQRPFIVCPSCSGEGYTSRLGAFTSSDMDEWYGDDWDARDEFVEAYTTRGGAYDKACDECHGERVVRDECPCDECEQEREWDAQYAAERAAEARMGC